MATGWPMATGSPTRPEGTAPPKPTATRCRSGRAARTADPKPAPPSQPATKAAPPGRCRAARTNRPDWRRRERRPDRWQQRVRPAGRPRTRPRGSRGRGWPTRASSACPRRHVHAANLGARRRSGHPTIGQPAVARRSGWPEGSAILQLDCRHAADGRGLDCRLVASSWSRGATRMKPVRRMLRPAERRPSPAGEGRSQQRTMSLMDRVRFNWAWYRYQRQQRHALERERRQPNRIRSLVRLSPSRGRSIH